ncbi:T9SS type A sorting domain-containing protein [Lacinutrix salivirga]
MKIKLLLLFCITTTLAIAQAPINNYFSPAMSQFAIVSGTIDQTPNGANAAWDFGTLTSGGTNTDTYAAPTAGELASYPGTTQVLTITDNASNTNQAFFKVTGSALSLIGASNPEFTLDYNTDNALVGSYPLTFGGTATVDAIAGTINAQGQSPTYTGTIITEVDAYGMLDFEVTGQGTYTGSVTRIKSEQSINFTLFGFIPGTALITSYNYYKDADGALVFRTSEGNVSVPGANINESFSSAEALITNTLSINQNDLIANTMSLYPNPTENVLTIKINNTVAIQSVKIIDINGRTVLTAEGNANTINVNALQTGLYTVSIITEYGIVNKKFIKK